MKHPRIWLMSMVLVLPCFSGVPLSSQEKVDVRQETIRLTAEDGGRLFAIYHYPDGSQPKTVILFMHPRGGNVTHFALQPWPKMVSERWAWVPAP